MDVHLCDGEGQSAFRALAAFESGGVKFKVATDLRNFDRDFAEAGLEGFGFEAVGVALAGRSALVRSSAESFGALGFHGMIEEDAERLGKPV